MNETNKKIKVDTVAEVDEVSAESIDLDLMDGNQMKQKKIVVKKHHSNNKVNNFGSKKNSE